MVQLPQTSSRQPLSYTTGVLAVPSTVVGLAAIHCSRLMMLAPGSTGAVKVSVRRGALGPSWRTIFTVTVRAGASVLGATMGRSYSGRGRESPVGEPGGIRPIQPPCPHGSACSAPATGRKNVFVLLPAVFWLSGQGKGLAESDVWAKVWPLLEAFGCFCLAASGSYCVNDALDAAKDRLHPVTRLRPVASGAIGAGVAVAVGCVLQMAAVAIGFLLVSRVVGACLLVYLVLQALYNMRLKRVPLVDVSALATGFCLRAAGGAAAIQVQMSVWLLLCVFFLTLFLGFTKRLCDLAAAENARAAGRARGLEAAHRLRVA